MDERPSISVLEGASFLVELSGILAALYPTQATIQHVITKAELEIEVHTFRPDIYSTWSQILVEAVRTHRLDALLNIVLIEHGRHQELLAAYGRLHLHGLVQASRQEVETRGDNSSAGDMEISVGDMEQAIGAAIGPGATSHVTIQHPISPEDRRNHRNHGILRQRIRRSWMHDYLRGSVYGQLPLRPDIQWYTDGGDDVSVTPYKQGTVEPGMSLAVLLDEVGQELLILGEPGSGKTTMLLELARALLNRAEADVTHATPVVLNLSSWAENRLPLAKWLVGELNIRYSIPKSVAKAWVETNELILLLDGLDEVQPVHRNDCVTAINQFRQEHLVPMVICCRRTEYESLRVRLKLQGAVLLQPLTPDQIEAYLELTGGDLSALRAALEQDQQLQEMARTPLLLNIMILAYGGLPPEAIETHSSAQSRYEHLLDTYIHRMLFVHRKLQPQTERSTDEYAPYKVLHWLHWLATRLVQQGQAIFLIEAMQFEWLERSTPLSSTLPLLVGLWAPLYGVLAGGLFGVVFGSLFDIVGNMSSIVTGSVQPASPISLRWGAIVFIGLIAGLCFGVLVAVIDAISGRLTMIRPVEWLGWTWPWPRSLNALLVGLYWGGSFGLSFGWFYDAGAGMLIGLLGGLIAGFSGALREMRPIRWSGWRSDLKKRPYSKVAFGPVCGLWVGLSLALLVSAIVGLLDGFSNGELVSAFKAALGSFLAVAPALVPGALIGGGLFGLLFEQDTGVVREHQDETQMPNQGIKLSAKNALAMWAAFGFFGLVVGWSLSIVTFRGEHYLGIVLGLPLALLGGLIGGGDAVLKHCILRGLLYLKGNIPLNYACFLDYAVDRIFLRRNGGGYIFMHRILMEYFAQMDEEKLVNLSQEGSNSLHT